MPLFTDGSQDCSSELQGMIYGCIKRIGKVNFAVKPLELPSGTLRLDVPLRISNVENFRLRGNCTTLIPGKSGMSCLLDINGAAYSTFEGVRFDQGPGNVKCVVHLRCDGIVRPLSSNVLRDVFIGGLKYVEGITIGEPGASTQEDQTTLLNCTINGQQAAGGLSDARWWQRGVKIGTGIAANNLIHNAFGCHVYSHRYNWDVWNSQLALVGGGVANAEIDFHSSTTSYCSITGVRSEGSARLFRQYGPVDFAANASLSDICFRGEALHKDGELIQHYAGGNLSLRSLYAIAPDLSRLRIAHGGRALATVKVDGLSVGGNGPTQAALFAGNWSGMRCDGYHPMDINGNPVS